MLKYGRQKVCFLLVAIFAPLAAAQASADEDSLRFAEQLQSNEPDVVVGDGQPGYRNPTQPERPQDLTLGNFFSAGWDDEWAKQERATGTPNLALLRVQTNFMEREFRANYYLENNVASTTTKNLTDFDALIAWSFNRRLMLEVTGAYQWTDPRTGAREDGGFPGLVGRVQLVDTESSSYSFNFKVAAPNPGVGRCPEHDQLRPGRIRGPGLLVWPQSRRLVLQFSLRQFRRAGCGRRQAKRRWLRHYPGQDRHRSQNPAAGQSDFLRGELRPKRSRREPRGTDTCDVTPGVRFNLGKAIASSSAKTIGSCLAPIFRYQTIALGRPLPPHVYQELLRQVTARWAARAWGRASVYAAKRRWAASP